MAFNWDQGKPVSTTQPPATGGGFDFSKGTIVDPKTLTGAPAPTEWQNPIKSMFSNIGSDIKQRFQNVMNPPAGSTLPEKIANVPGQIAGGVQDILGEGIKAVGGVASELFSETPLGELPHQAAVSLLQSPVGQAGLKAIQGGVDSYTQWSQVNPRQARQLENVVNIGVMFPEIKAGLSAGKAALETGSEMVSGIPSRLKSAAEEIKGLPVKMAATKEEQALKTSIEAVSPELTGKKATESFNPLKGAGLKTGITTPLEAETSREAKRLGTALKDLNLTSDPIKNSPIISNAMKDTESKLSTLLKSDNTPIIKQAFNDSLDTVKKGIPREFRSVPTQVNAYNSTINFIKEQANKMNPNINGLREMRKELDAQFEKQFPNAFKDGHIDTKTAWGSAYKAGRDHINQYLYNTAEKGSEIQKMIGREADLYKAADNIAPKIKALQGTLPIGRFLNDHPILKFGLYGAGGLILERATKGIGAPVP